MAEFVFRKQLLYFITWWLGLGLKKERSELFFITFVLQFIDHGFQLSPGSFEFPWHLDLLLLLIVFSTKPLFSG